MNCQELADMLDERDSGSLGTAERIAVEAHIGRCAECAAAFRAHEAMRLMPLPAMDAGLAAHCRQLVTAAAAAPVRRAGGRPFIVAGLVLAGVAAAAVVGLQLVESVDPGEEFAAGADAGPEVPGVAVTVPAGSPSDTDTDAGDTAPQAQPAVAADVPRPEAAGFTVAVRHHRRVSDPQALPAVDRVYRAFLDALGALPNLELIELETVVEPQATVAAFSAARSEDTGETSGSRTLVLVDSRVLADSRGAGLEPGSEAVDLTTVPTALVGRIETLTGGASAAYAPAEMAGVVNVILDNNIRGVRLDLNVDTSIGIAEVDPEPPLYDYELAVTSTTSVSRLNFSVQGRSGNATTAASASANMDELSDGHIVNTLIDALRESLFPVDAALLAELEQSIRDSSLPTDERLEAVGRLIRINRRTGETRLSSELALAMTDLASQLEGGNLNLLWRHLRGFDNTELVQALGYSLRYDADETVRLEAAMTLAGLGDDPAARMALEVAANVDASAAVRQTARWASLDEAGRRDLVVSNLFDTRLSDAERIEMLLFEPVWAGDPLLLGSVVDARVVNEISALLQRRPSVSERRRVLQRLGQEANPLFTPLLLERLNADESESVRASAAVALRPYLDEAGVRISLERAASADTSQTVRAAARSALTQLN